MENWTYVYSSTCRYILKRNFGTCGAGDVCENFLNGNVQTSKNKTKQKWGKTRYYCKENEYMVHLHNVGLFCSENEWTATTCNNMGESWKHNIAWKNQTLQDKVFNTTFTEFRNKMKHYVVKGYMHMWCTF